MFNIRLCNSIIALSTSTPYESFFIGMKGPYLTISQIEYLDVRKAFSSSCSSEQIYDHLNKEVETHGHTSNHLSQDPLLIAC